MSSLLKLTKRHEFIKVAQQGKHASASSIIVQWLPPTENNVINRLRVGFTASKRVGNAIRRNKAKRRLREAIRLVAAEQQDLSGDIVLIAKPKAVDVDYAIIIRDLRYCLRKCLEAPNGNETPHL